jgi:hypothetical protein
MCNQNEPILPEDDFVFGAQEELDDDEFEFSELNDVFKTLAAFGNPEHHDYDVDEDDGEKIGCEDCALGLCDCRYEIF